MKNKKNFIKYLKPSLMILFILILSIPLIRQDFNVADDTSFHLLRIDEIYNNLKLGYILPTIYSNSLNNYGYASAFFYPDIFLYIPALLMYCGLSLITSYKIFLFIINITTLIITYYCIKKITKSNNIAYLTAIAYTGNLYRVITVYQRGALGEVLALIFIPIVILGVYQIIYEKKWLSLCIGFTLIIYSHVISTYMLLLICSIYFIYNYKKVFKKDFIINISKAILATIGLTAPFTFSLFYMMSKDIYRVNTTYTFELTDKLFKIVNYDTNNWLYFFMFIIILFSIYAIMKFIFKKFNVNRGCILGYNLIFLGLLCILGTTNLVPWNIISKFIFKLEVIQFPFRFCGIGMLFLTLGISIILDNSDINKLFQSLMILFSTVAISITFILMIVIPQNNKYVVNYYNVGQAEYIPDNCDISYLYSRESLLTTDDGEIVIIGDNHIDLKDRYIHYKASKNNIDIELPYLYYDGYKVTINNQEVELHRSKNSFIEVNIEDNIEGIIHIEYKQPIIQYISILIFILTLLIMELKYIYDTNKPILN